MEEVVIVIAILETFPRRKISIVTNTTNLLLAEATNLHIIAETNMKSKSICLRSEKRLLVRWETKEAAPTITVAATLSSKTTIIINTTTSRAAMREVPTTRVMEISNNKKTMGAAATDPQCPLMKTRLTSK
jgi:hypothetical protein